MQTALDVLRSPTIGFVETLLLRDFVLEIFEALPKIGVIDLGVGQSGGARDGAHLPEHPATRRIAVVLQVGRLARKWPTAAQRDDKPQLTNQLRQESVIHPTVMPTAVST